MTIVPKGDEFLSMYTNEELNSLYREETHPKAKVRLLAAILRKESMTLQEISNRIKYPLTTVGDWLRRMHLEGISKRYNKKQPGKSRRLTDEQIEKLKSVLSQLPLEQGLPFIFWTTKLVRDFIGQHYGISYKNRQVRNLLHRLGFSSQKPRQKHLKANKKLQEVFKKTSGKESALIAKMDSRSYFWMKASSQ